MTTPTPDTLTIAEQTDVLVIRSGELRPEITDPTVIGLVVRITRDHEVADAIRHARTLLPQGEWTETLRVVVAAAGCIGVDDDA